MGVPREILLFSLVGLAQNACTTTASPAASTTEPAVRARPGRSVPRLAAVTDLHRPFIVDWRQQEQNDLAVAMRSSIAIVALDSTGLRLLPDCQLPGEYGYMGMNRRQELVTLDDVDQLYANLPNAAARFTEEFRDRLGHDATVEVAIVSVGQWSTTWRSATPSDLTEQSGGACAGATHFIRSASVGAYALRDGQASSPRTIAQLFGFARAEQTAVPRLSRSRGVLADCDDANPDTEKPPGRCDALLQLGLVGLDGGTERSTTATSVRWDADCPHGFVQSRGRCIEHRQNLPAFTCRPDDEAECREQCSVGDAASCALLGEHLLSRSPVASTAEAAELFRRACTQHHADACYRLGWLSELGHGVEQDAFNAVTHYKRSCDEGHARACAAQAHMFLRGQGVTEDPKRATRLFRRACRGGDPDACSTLGALALAGGVTPGDEEAAARWFKLACDGGHAVACSSYGNMAEFGRGAAKNVSLAVRLYGRACREDAAECFWLGLVSHVGAGVPNDERAARSLYTKACRAADGAVHPSGYQVACALLNVLYGESHVLHSEAGHESVQNWKSTCTSGAERDCALAGVLLTALVGVEQGRPILEMGCRAGDPWACRLLQQAPWMASR